MRKDVAERLIPELALWNDGRGIPISDWIFIEGRADHALAFQSMFWPEFQEIEGSVLREPVDTDRFLGWKATGASRAQIETAMNAYHFDMIFPRDETEPSLKAEQLQNLAKAMCGMLASKLKAEYPDREFATFVVEGDDFGVSFHQASR
jgi:hypothetical protein